MKGALGLVLVIAVCSGCASSGPPAASTVAYPAKGQNAEQQLFDKNECQVWAQQQTGYDPAKETGKGAAVGGLLGAAAGAATGAAVGAVAGGHAGTGAAAGAIIGGVGGTAGGGAYQYSKTKNGYEQAYSACMQGRGYSVGR
jgi:hypothetical protein